MVYQNSFINFLLIQYRCIDAIELYNSSFSMGVLTQLNYRAMRCSHSQVQAVRKELKDKSYKIHVCVIVNNGLTFVFAFILLNVNVYFLTEYTFGF